jgi:hypothetical protein
MNLSRLDERDVCSVITGNKNWIGNLMKHLQLLKY